MNIPFMLTPAAKSYLWGGSRLNDDFGKNINLEPLAETWECSTHPCGQSTVAGGEFQGMLLGDVLDMHPEFLGTHPLEITHGRSELPILIKLIDAKQDLSVQVHPDDEYALKHENSLGKTELWYVLDAKRGASLVYGFNQDMTEQRVREALADETIGNYLNCVPVHKNDLFYIEAGTIHAIGAGALIAEIQENSDITYRLYDYERVGSDGKKRPLHIDQAMNVINLKSSDTPRQPMRVLKYKNGAASELLNSCKYFQVERLLLNTEIHRSLMKFQTGSNSFHALLCVDGCGVLFGEGVTLPFFKGDCIFVPSESIPMKLHGKAQILNVSC